MRTVVIVVLAIAGYIVFKKVTQRAAMDRAKTDWMQYQIAKAREGNALHKPRVPVGKHK